MEVITDEVREIEEYIHRTWKQFSTKKEVRLRDLFPEPSNGGLRHIWLYGSADLVIWRNGRLVCLTEAGGMQHWEENQNLNDRRKWKLAEINGVKCLFVRNGTMRSLSRRKWRSLLGSFLFGVT